ncbi:MAG: hypothetical protein KJN61_02165 [Gammaproteobacteria bacterium]|nr:hypothetical protein [Gammaproteobacteria bacterium]MBT8075249.1 hypothetical protein [Gammaproteobacteria bacterium]
MTAKTRRKRRDFYKAYAKAVRKFGARNYVTGIDLGNKYRNGRRLRQKVIRIHVREKFDESVLEPKEIFPTEIDDVPVDVIEATYEPSSDLTLLRERRDPLDPVQPGVSVSHPNANTGTIGLIVYDQRTGQPCILSNWHVLAGSRQAQINDPVIQPGAMDGGYDPAHQVGRLARWVIGQKGDAAIAWLNDRRNYASEQFESEVVIHSARMPRYPEVLVKSGRSTGVTKAVIDGRGQYNIYFPDIGRVSIDGFRLVPIRRGNPRDEEITEDGDSGALWYSEETLEGVGINFAGERNHYPAREHALACFLPVILDELDVSLSPP